MGIELSIRAQDRAALAGAKLTGRLRQAVHRAGATALRDMRAETSKRVRARKRLKASMVAAGLRRRPGRGVWALDVSGRRVPLSGYPHRATKRGVVVEVNRGKRTLIRSAFLASLASGHKGVFLRRGVARLPIDERFGSRLSDAVAHPEVHEPALRRGYDSFGRTMGRLLDRA